MRKFNLFILFLLTLSSFFVFSINRVYAQGGGGVICDGYCDCGANAGVCGASTPVTPGLTCANDGVTNRCGGESYTAGNCPPGTAPNFNQFNGCSVAPPNCCTNAPDGHVVYAWGEDHQDYWECSWACTPVCSPSGPTAPTLVSPANASFITPTGSTVQVTLDWSDLAANQWGTACTTPGNLYQVWLWSSDNQVWRSLGNVASSTSQYTITANAGVVYYWTVYSYNGQYYSAAPTPWYFSVRLPDDPWWQVKDGDITTNGSISSDVPTGGLFDTIGAGGFAGVPVFGTTFNLSTTPTKISTAQWSANTTTGSSRLFDYSYFENLIPGDTLINSIGNFPSGGTSSTDGYEWYKVTGNVDYNIPDINLGSRKVILFIDGNLNIYSKINLNDDSGFFAVFVKGNINVLPQVTGSPSLEGLYLSDGIFNTGAGTSQLHIRGSVVSKGGIVLLRDLVDDSVGPAELFEFAPDQILLFPEKLGFRGQRWTEVAP